MYVEWMPVKRSSVVINTNVPNTTINGTRLPQRVFTLSVRYPIMVLRIASTTVPNAIIEPAAAGGISATVVMKNSRNVHTSE